MKKTPIPSLPREIPDAWRSRLAGAPLFDSSSSPEARVIYAEYDGGVYCKIAPAGRLAQEAQMTEYFHGKGLAPAVLDYRTGARDLLVTRAAEGEDATHPDYLSDPARLAAVMGKGLRALHDSDASGCPVPRRMDGYFALVEANYQRGMFDPSYLSSHAHFATAAEAYAVYQNGKDALKNDTLIHGDYCLPNIMLRNFRISAFVDVGNGGVGDRHVDLFWGAWSLVYNLRTEKYCDRFLDAYGRERVERELLFTVAAAECFG